MENLLVEVAVGIGREDGCEQAVPIGDVAIHHSSAVNVAMSSPSASMGVFEGGRPDTISSMARAKSLPVVTMCAAIWLPLHSPG